MTEAEKRQRRNAREAARKRRFRAENPNAARELDARWRNSRRLKVVSTRTAPITKAELDARLAEFCGGCAYGPLCSFEEWDHVVPLDAGGTDTIDNLVPSCRAHNRSKGRKTLFEWLRTTYIPVPLSGQEPS